MWCHSHRLKKRCWPCRTSAQSGSAASWSARPEKSRPSTRRACAWASATWCWLTSLPKASATASPGPRAAGSPISTRIVLRGHSGAAAAGRTISPVREERRLSRAGVRPCLEVDFHRGATPLRVPQGPCQKAAWGCETALRPLGGPPRRGALSRAWVGAPASHLRYPTVHTCPTHRRQCVCANPEHTNTRGVGERTGSDGHREQNWMLFFHPFCLFSLRMVRPPT